MQCLYCYLCFLLYFVSTVYALIYVAVLYLFWISSFISFFKGDFFASIILMIELTIFLIILIFSFLNAVWVQNIVYIRRYKINFTVVLIFTILITQKWLNFAAFDRFWEYCDLVHNRSDLRLLLYALYGVNIFLSFFILLIVGILLFYLLVVSKYTCVKYSVFFKHQNFMKQQMRVGSVRSVRHIKHNYTKQ